MKFGYHCQCGWRLNRGKLTRKMYALQKQNHALGRGDSGGKPCKFLAAELASTQKDAFMKGELLSVARG